MNKANRTKKSAHAAPSPATPMSITTLTVYAALQQRRASVQGDLDEETQWLIHLGARPADILWLLTPLLCGAVLAYDALPMIAAGDADLARDLEEHQRRVNANQILCVYMGPEGTLALPVHVEVVPPAA